MLEIEENLRTPKYFLGSGLMRNIYIRYHICYMRIKSRRVSLERWFDVKYSSCRQTSCLLGVLRISRVDLPHFQLKMASNPTPAVVTPHALGARVVIVCRYILVLVRAHMLRTFF